MVLLNALMTVLFANASTEGLRNGEHPYYKLLLNMISSTVRALNSLITQCSYSVLDKPREHRSRSAIKTEGFLSSLTSLYQLQLCNIKCEKSMIMWRSRGFESKWSSAWMQYPRIYWVSLQVAGFSSDVATSKKTPQHVMYCYLMSCTFSTWYKTESVSCKRKHN